MAWQAGIILKIQTSNQKNSHFTDSFKFLTSRGGHRLLNLYGLEEGFHINVLLNRVHHHEKIYQVECGGLFVKFAEETKISSRAYACILRMEFGFLGLHWGPGLQPIYRIPNPHSRRTQIPTGNGSSRYAVPPKTYTLPSSIVPVVADCSSCATRCYNNTHANFHISGLSPSSSESSLSVCSAPFHLYGFRSDESSPPLWCWFFEWGRSILL